MLEKEWKRGSFVRQGRIWEHLKKIMRRLVWMQEMIMMMEMSIKVLYCDEIKPNQ